MSVDSGRMTKEFSSLVRKIVLNSFFSLTHLLIRDYFMRTTLSKKKITNILLTYLFYNDYYNRIQVG